MNDVNEIMRNLGVKRELTLSSYRRAWMYYHDFVVISKIEQLDEVLEDALRTGKCSLDLETTGLDNRVYNKKPAELRGKIEEPWDGVAPDTTPTTVDKIVGYCLSPDGHTGYYVPVRHSQDNLDLVQVGKRIQKLCRLAQPTLTPEGLRDDPLASPFMAQRPRVKLFFWNAKFDHEMLYPVTGIDFWHPDSFEDGILAYFTLYTSDLSLSLKDKARQELVVLRDGEPVKAIVTADQRSHLLETVVESVQGQPIPYNMLEMNDLFAKGRKIAFDTLVPEEAKYYACGDAICTFLLCDSKKMRDFYVDPVYMGWYRLEKMTSNVVRWMERNRIKIDVATVEQLYQDVHKESEELLAEIRKAAATYPGFQDFDPQSPKQLGDFLFERGLNLSPKPEKNEKSGQYKTTADVLKSVYQSCQNPILLQVLKLRQLEKISGTYLDSMKHNHDQFDELRVSFKQIGAATGRFSAPAGSPEHGYSGVPIHGIPSNYDESKPKAAMEIRKAFIARPGYTMVKIDFAGEELRIIAALSREPKWLHEFNHGTGDLHTITAKAMFGENITKKQRQYGKSVNFGLAYGGGPAVIQRATGCSRPEAVKLKEKFDQGLEGFARWAIAQKRNVKTNLYVETLFKRRIALPHARGEATTLHYKLNNNDYTFKLNHSEKGLEEEDYADRTREDSDVIAANERFSLNYAVQGTGADIMKIVMVMLYKHFHKAGWLDDATARFMLTVHDEIVFEVKHEKLQEVVPVLCSIMVSPFNNPGIPLKLEVEPLLDKHWKPKYNWYDIMKGKQPVPDWLVGHVKPDTEYKGTPEVGVNPPKEPPKIEPPTQSSAAPPLAAIVKPNVTPTVLKPETAPEIFRYPLGVALTDHSATMLAQFVGETEDPNGVLLELHTVAGVQLIHATDNIRVDQKKFQALVNHYQW